MNKSKFIMEVAAKLGQTPTELEKTFNTIIKEIYQVLRDGEKLNICGFGSFSISHRASRIGINPRNPSQRIVIPELITPKFKAGEAFKAAIK